MADAGCGKDISMKRTKANGLKLLRLSNTSMFIFYKILKTVSYWKHSKE